MTVILPGIFPYLVTGLITASGGAWNASIVAEYFRMNDHTYTTLGLGAQISLANDSGNGRLLLLSTVVMAALVVTINRLLWKPLFRLAEGRYRLDGSAPPQVVSTPADTSSMGSLKPPAPWSAR